MVKNMNCLVGTCQYNSGNKQQDITGKKKSEEKACFDKENYKDKVQSALTHNPIRINQIGK